MDPEDFRRFAQRMANECLKTLRRLPLRNPLKPPLSLRKALFNSSHFHHALSLLGGKTASERQAIKQKTGPILLGQPPR